MRRHPLFIILACFLFFCFSGRAQKKDSAAAAAKDENKLIKKRKYTWFVSDRLSEDNKFDIFKFTPVNQSPSPVIVRGHMEVVGNPNQKKARISVFNITTGDLVGVYNTNGFTGNYVLILVPNVKYQFKIDVSGYGSLEDVVEVPMKTDYEICRQDLKIRLNERNKPVLSLSNYFIDENEKVFYLKAPPDTLHPEEVTLHAKGARSADGKSKSMSNIDELVKKALEEERKKPGEALKAFKSQDYETALSYYSSLIKNDPADPFMNYYYGVSLLKQEGNKAKAINALQLASHYKEVPYDVFYYLGLASHLSYLFSDAIVALEEFKKRAKPAEISQYKIAQLLNYCRNGSSIISEQVYIDVLKRSPMTDQNLINYFNPEQVSEVLKYKTDFFNSAFDKKKQEKLMMCRSGNSLVYVSYGEDGKNGTDLFVRKMRADGSYGPARSLGAHINTALDENYPFITPDGKQLYFASKGHSSIGGYDIFRCTREDTAAEWSLPKNIGYPINSTYDDYLYVGDEAGNYGSYFTTRKGGQSEFMQIRIPHKELATSVIKGCFLTDSALSKEAIISVYNAGTGEIAGVFRANTNSGLYLMILNAGIKYDMTVEAEGFPTLNSSFEVPSYKSDVTLKQVVSFKSEGPQKSQKVKNYFTETESAKIDLDALAKPVVAEKKEAEKKPAPAKKGPRTPEEIKKDEEDLAEAKNLFNQQIYQEAALLYKTLEQHLPLDGASLLRYGICLYHTKKDWIECIRILQAAVAVKNPDPEAYYYLARSCQLSYRFSSALAHYKKFSALAKPAELQRLGVEKEMEHCSNGIRLVNNPVVIEVHEKKHVDINALQNAFTHLESGSRILLITDDMRSSIDKKKNYRSLLYLSPDKNTLLYTSYGEDEKNGKDIYMVKKLSGGKWATPQHLGAVYSESDEEFPSLSKDGKTLYFSSRGFENMGGYDIFQSSWDESTQNWSAPVNLGSPVNSPFDDIYFLE